MKSWKDKQEWGGQLRKGRLFDWISKKLDNRLMWGLWKERIFSSPWKYEEAILTDPIFWRCRYVKSMLLSEACGLEVEKDIDKMIESAASFYGWGMDPMSPRTLAGHEEWMKERVRKVILENVSLYRMGYTNV